MTLQLGGIYCKCGAWIIMIKIINLIKTSVLMSRLRTHQVYIIDLEITDNIFISVKLFTNKCAE